MATVKWVWTIDYVADMLGEDLEMLEAIVSNDDNLAYASIITVCAGPEKTITALTNDGIDELRDMLTAARRSTQDWDEFLDSFVDDPDIIERIKKNTPR